ncbi:MAG: cytochrome c [Burkholderiales bacterium]|nr:cytochrome c [Burkholderiales bacterium]
MLGLAALVCQGEAPAQDAGRGAYLARAGGCLGCHTETRQDAAPFAGGRALKTPFGTFHGPNITPDPSNGLGRWTEADFMKAMRLGVRPDGAHLYPAFPYPSFTGIMDGDLRDLWAFLRTVKPSAQANRPHELRFPFDQRWLLAAWKWLFFKPGPFAPEKDRSIALNRGAYLANALGHCGECHTPRNFLGAMNKDRMLAGGKTPEGKDVANLTPAKLKKWSDGELKDFLTTGLTADGDVPAEAMAEVIRNTTSQLTPDDLSALIAYLRSLRPVEDVK